MHAHLRAFIDDLLRPVNPTFNIIFGMFGICWGLWVMAPWWDVFSTAVAFEALGRPSELLWGFLAFVTGSLVSWGAINPTYIRLAVGLGSAAFFWAWTASVLLFGDWHNTAWIVYGSTAVYATMLYVNVKYNHDLGYDWTGRHVG